MLIFSAFLIVHFALFIYPLRQVQGAKQVALRVVRPRRKWGRFCLWSTGSASFKEDDTCEHIENEAPSCFTPNIESKRYQIICSHDSAVWKDAYRWRRVIVMTMSMRSCVYDTLATAYYWEHILSRCCRIYKINVSSVLHGQYVMLSTDSNIQSHTRVLPVSTRLTHSVIVTTMIRNYASEFQEHLKSDLSKIMNTK